MIPFRESGFGQKDTEQSEQDAGQASAALIAMRLLFVFQCNTIKQSFCDNDLYIDCP
jgi:hypothetical protein